MFADQIDSKYMHRIPLKCICNLNKINFQRKIDLKACCTLQTDMKQLIESKKRWLLLVRWACTLFLLEHPIYKMNRFCLKRFFDSTLKQSCSHQKFLGWVYKKNPTKNHTNYKQGLRNLRQLQRRMRSKNDKKNWAIKHIGRVQWNKYDEVQYLKRQAKTYAMETICCLAL